MEKINEENKMWALIPATVCDTTSIYKETTLQILSQILDTQNTKKTEEQETQNTRKTGEKQEISILPSFLHIVTCCLTIAKTDRINTFVDYVKDKCNHIGLDGSSILRNIKLKMKVFLEFTKQHNDFVHQNLDWFQQRLFDIYVICNQYKHKTIEAPKITTKYRTLCPVVIREAKIDESDEDSDNNIISNIVVIQGGILTYSHQLMTISCMTRDGNRIDVHCASSVTDFTRIAQDTVLATLPFRKIILFISSVTVRMRRFSKGFYKVSYLGQSLVAGVELFGKIVYLVDWLHNTIKNQFITKEIPSDIAVGPQSNLLISFSNINKVICYDLGGHRLFEVETHSLNLATSITVYQNHFYVLQGHFIYRISGKGSVAKRDIGMKCRSISVGTGTIFVTDYLGVPHAIGTNNDFWRRQSYNHQLHTPTLKDNIYIEDCYKITDILPISTSFILIIYRNKKAILFTDNGEIISQNNLTFLKFPSIFCRLNSNRFLVFYRETKKLQYITCPELIKGPLLKVHTDYIKICHIVSNMCLGLTTGENKNEVHILLIKEDEVEIMQRISVGHENVTIAATPINFVVVDGRKHKLVFYSTFGEELFEKYLPFYGDPHHIYSDNLYFYVLFKRQSIVICYDIYGEMKWQWKLPFHVHRHIAVFQGTIYVPDIQLNRVLLYKYPGWSCCCLNMKNPYIKNLNLRIKENEDNKIVIAEICHLANGQLVVSDIKNDCLLYISNEGDIVSRLSLPSTATDICRWDSNQIGVTLPLEKQLRVIGNLSKTVRTVSLSHPYVRVCKLGKSQIVCYCDKPSHLDILALKNYNQVEIIRRINIPFVVKSLAIENETPPKLLIVTRKKAFQYSISIDGGGHGSTHSSCDGSIKMVPNVLLSRMEPPPNLYGGSIDKMFVYLIDDRRLFAINGHNLVVRDHVRNNQLNISIDLVDVFSRNICVSEMLSSTLYLEDLTVSDKARHIHVADIPLGFRNKRPVCIHCLVITGNNLIAGYDRNNGNIMIFTFDGQLLNSIKLDAGNVIKMCRWQSNTLIITTNEYQLLTLKVEFPLSLVIYQTKNKYECIASLSNNQLVCSKLEDECSLYVVDIDEIDLTVNENKQIDIPETLLTRDEDSNSDYINDIRDIIVTAENVLIVKNKRFIIFFNSDGEYLYSVRHYMEYFSFGTMMTLDDSSLYICGRWGKYHNVRGYKNIICLTQTGEYNRIFLNNRIDKDKIDFLSINCKGQRFVGSICKGTTNKLYVEGLFRVRREVFPVPRLQTDNFSVQIKDIDISDEGQTVVCDRANNTNVKIFDTDGKLLCHRNLGTLVGGVCFTRDQIKSNQMYWQRAAKYWGHVKVDRYIMVTVPNRREIFQLKQQDLKKYKDWESRVPYGVIWRKVGNIYCCVHINLIEKDYILIDGDQLKVLESMPLLNLDSGLHFPSITSQMYNEISSEELITKLNYSGGERRGQLGEIFSKDRLNDVRCGNYIAETRSGIDEMLVRRLPYRTAMVPLSIPTLDEPVNYDFMDIRDRNSKLIKLDDNVSVLMFRDTVTLINTTTGDILQHKQLPQQQQPIGICRWTDEEFIVVFGKEMMVFNRDLSQCLKTIKTEKYYNTIYKYNDNQLVCGGHYIRDITQDERDQQYQRTCYNNNIYYWCKDPGAYDSYYVDVVDINDGICEYEVCRGETGVFGKVEGDAVVRDVAVTSFYEVVVVRRKKVNWWDDYDCRYVVEWYRKEWLIQRIELKPEYNILNNDTYRPCLTAIGEYVYITDTENNIYQIPEQIEDQTSNDIQNYLLRRKDDNEVFQVLGFDISENFLMYFGIIPGRQSFAFFYYDE